MAYLGTKPANQVIDSTLIADGTVTTSDLANGAVTDDKIAAMAASKLTGQLTTANIANDAITADKIAANAVSSSEIADAAVGYTKIANDNQSFKYRGSFPTANSQNFNTVQASGTYNIVTGNYSGTSNAPPNYGYGIMLVMNGGSFQGQVYYPHQAQAASYRVAFNGGGWQAWRTFG